MLPVITRARWLDCCQCVSSTDTNCHMLSAVGSDWSRFACASAYPPDLAHRDRYRKRCTDDGMHRDLIVHFISMQYLITSPFCPHMSEYIWKMLGNQGSILNARWPARTEPNPQHLLMSKYMENMEAKARQSLDKLKKPATKGEHYDCGSNSSNSCNDYLFFAVTDVLLVLLTLFVPFALVSCSFAFPFQWRGFSILFTYLHGNTPWQSWSTLPRCIRRGRRTSWST